MNVVLYDGDCGFCSFWVQWILKYDRHDRFRFASLQGSYGQEFLRLNNLPNKEFDTVYLVTPAKSYARLAAVGEIGSLLGGVFSLLKVLGIIPSIIADPIYDKIARKRKTLAAEACLLPTPAERKKFL